MDAIYWVISKDCNQRCPHCYNNSEPGAPGLLPEQIIQCVSHFPDPARVAVRRIIISGGEVLIWPDLLFHGLSELHRRYGNQTELWIQTNGDLLDEPTLDKLLSHNVTRIDIASMDRFHRKSTRQRYDYLSQLLQSRGMALDSREDERNDSPADEPGSLHEASPQLTYAFWGANEDEWIGPIWPRGRAMTKKLSRATPGDRFCSIWSGAKNFLNYQSEQCEINIQLSDVYPCCPMTFRPIGDLLSESLTDILDRCKREPVFQSLNEGRPEAMGQSLGLSEEYGSQRSFALGNHCLWCDEFFAEHAPHLLKENCRTERGTTDLVQIGWSPNQTVNKSK